jgi:hypothetical protein
MIEEISAASSYSMFSQNLNLIQLHLKAITQCKLAYKDHNRDNLFVLVIKIDNLEELLS